MRTIIITFTHEGMKVAKKASEAMDGEVIYTVTKYVQILIRMRQYHLWQLEVL